MQASSRSTENSVQNKGSRLRALIALIVAIVAVLAVIIVAKVVQDDQAAKPVSLSNPELPDNDSPACTDLVAALPDRLHGLVRAELADPAPAGAAVWRNIEDDRITLRCGVSMPTQYNALATTQDIDGVKWLKITDDADASLATWFAVGRSPIVAVTTESGDEDSDKAALGQLAEFLRPDAEVGNAPEPGPVPLTQLTSNANDEKCRALAAALPNEIASRPRVATEDLPEGTPKDLLVYNDGKADPIIIRCGVEEPAGYATTTEQLTQVNDIVWFNEPSLSAGTSGTWFAMGRERFVAINLPMGETSSVLPRISDIISANLVNTAPSEEK